jgi:hypothetical protein
MSPSRKQTAGDEPVPQQRDERGGVRRQTQRGRREPKLPHERDEATGRDASSSAAGAAPKPVMEQASDDLATGKQDTDRGPVMDATYQKQKK